ncbi:hypothetical protein E2C01_031796 [Portunus trituberculatus]|uniref:Uncharacterized protein n=1 Tax=Portunus trituberculatus TaxID=210409 RepID=A0A5B7ETR3_PORTR|nr:hypothetical protein [Portunus trituberculatus]
MHLFISAIIVSATSGPSRSRHVPARQRNTEILGVGGPVSGEGGIGEARGEGRGLGVERRGELHDGDEVPGRNVWKVGRP